MQQHTANHTIDPSTGFIVNKAFDYAFNAERKLSFVDLLKQGYTEIEAGESLGLHRSTVKKHLTHDPVFYEACREALELYGAKLESVSRINALNPKAMIERFFQLKALFPAKYGDVKASGPTQIIVNVGNDALDISRKRQEAVESRIIDVLAVGHDAPMDTITSPVRRKDALSGNYDGGREGGAGGRPEVKNSFEGAEKSPEARP